MLHHAKKIIPLPGVRGGGRPPGRTSHPGEGLQPHEVALLVPQAVGRRVTEDIPLRGPRGGGRVPQKKERPAKTAC